MSNLDKKYSLRLDLKFNYTNSIMKFDEFDINTSDFFIRITRDKELIDISEAIVTLVAIKPDGSVDSQFVTINENNFYCDLKPSMKDLPGKYEALASISLNGETVNTNPENPLVYEVTENKFLRQLNTEVVAEERFSILTDMINRLSSIENSELSRQEAELSREEAEKLRQEAIEKVKTDIAKLISDTNSKVTDNLQENTAKTDKLVTDTNKKIDNYKLAKDEAIQQDLQLYKQETTENINTYKSDKNIEIDNYKSTKDTEINKNLSDYKTNTTADIETYKNNKNAEINQYKTEKDLEIDTYVANKNKELDRYVADKNNDIDNYKNSKDTLINNKLEEVDTAEQSRVEAEQKRVTDHAERETFLNSFESQLGQIVSKNGEQDGRLNSIEYVNKRQDVMLGGLFNENADGRLSIEGEGNSVKLEGSKEGLVEVEKVVGDTMVNLASVSYRTLTYEDVNSPSDMQIQFLKPNTTYTIILSTKYTNDGDVGGIKLILSDSTNVTLTGSLTNSETLYKFVATTPSDVSNFVLSATGNYITIHNLVILEGDYTNKPIPSEYFEGMQSTFEDKLVTQEMVDAGKELAENLGKYKASIKVVGKNLFDGIWESGTINQDTGNLNSDKNMIRSNYVEVKPNTNYIASSTVLTKGVVWHSYDKNYNYIDSNAMQGLIPYTTPSNAKYIKVRTFLADSGVISLTCPLQLEEGTQATQYEEYKEYKTSILLDEPLYKGNELCVHEGKLGYWKKCEKVVLDGSEDEGWVVYGGVEDIRFAININCVLNKWSKVVCDKIPSYSILSTVDQYSSYIIANGWTRTLIVRNTSTFTTLDELKAWLQANPTTVVYELAEPYFVPILEDTPQWILDCYNSCTVQFETNVPILSSSFTYTGNVPSVYKIEETGVTNTNDIAVTQTAVDFLLMSSMGEVMMMSFKNNTKGGNNMGAYFASRIMKKALKYEDVIRKYPEFKEDIDFILRSEGRDDLITV